MVISDITPMIISLLPRSPVENRDRVALLHRNTFTICITMMALKQAVVACRYTGSFAARFCPYFHPAMLSTKKKAAMAPAASIRPRNRYARNAKGQFTSLSPCGQGDLEQQEAQVRNQLRNIVDQHVSQEFADIFEYGVSLLNCAHDAGEVVV